LTDRLSSEAERFIDHAQKEAKPFFLLLSHHAPHTPIEAKAELVARYKAKRRAGMKHQNAVYAAMVASLDESVGRVMAHLEKRRLAGNTTVVFLSDNGGAVQEWQGEQITNNAPLRSGKGSAYEGGIRIPLLVRSPQWTRPGETRSELVSTLDVFTTLAELGGADTKSGLDGYSLRGGGKREELFFHYPHYYPTTTPASAIRRGDWKLVEFYEDGRKELYNIARDLSESQNLVTQETRIVQELSARLAEWRRQMNAPRPRLNPAMSGALPQQAMLRKQ
jgi:arylsulfatase A-like enzyme